MKKFLTVLALVLVCACVFASSKVSASFDSYSLQKFVQKDGDVKEKVNSKYGLGAAVGYTHDLPYNTFVGAEVKFDTYYIKDQTNFKDLGFFAKGGYVYNLEENIDLFADAKLGLDLQFHEKETSAVMQFGAEVGGNYAINDKFNAFCSVEFLFGFPKKDEVKYTEFRVTPVLGVSYNF